MNEFGAAEGKRISGVACVTYIFHKLLTAGDSEFLCCRAILGYEAYVSTVQTDSVSVEAEVHDSG